MRFVPLVLLSAALVAALPVRRATAEEPTPAAAESAAPGAPAVAAPASVALPEVTALRLKTVVLERATILEHLQSLQTETTMYQGESQRRTDALRAQIVDAARAAGVDPEAYDYEPSGGRLVRKGGAPATGAAP